jgi:hypothetical protein
VDSPERKITYLKVNELEASAWNPYLVPALALFKRDWPFPPHIQDMLAALQH